MNGALSIRCFAHSWVSDWNHGNAHFLRGLASSLMKSGHDVRCYEQFGAWSLNNLVRLEGERASQAIEDFRRLFPSLDVRFFNLGPQLDEMLRQELRGADLVLIHEWNEPELVNTVLALKRELGFRTLFHDTHHRAYTNPREILRFRLQDFDGVLAFGEAIRRIYAEGFGVHKAWTFHEAADTTHFFPMNLPKDNDVVWVGNWGDEERTQELQEFLIGPASELRSFSWLVHGVRYPRDGIERLREAGIRYGEYLPNLNAPKVYGRSKLSVHVPRRQYANGLSGIPTIRVFEVMACGIPLVCSPWADVEGLFRAGEDYLVVPDGQAMRAEIARLVSDDRARAQIGQNAVQTIRSRHTCDHRAQQLLDIYEEMRR